VTYSLVPVEGLRRADVERVRRIYEAGFPARLRADFGSLLDGRLPGELAFALTEEGRPVGFAMLRPLGTTGWIFLRYFVVDAARRGRGLGAIL
jgi:GNAT superfamily N-acetyltransferase